MEAISSTETSIYFQRTTQRYIPEDNTLHNYHCENLKSYTIRECFLTKHFIFLVVLVLLWRYTIVENFLFVLHHGEVTIYGTVKHSEESGSVSDRCVTGRKYGVPALAEGDVVQHGR
jgi:hypothetical protein